MSIIVLMIKITKQIITIIPKIIRSESLSSVKFKSNYTGVMYGVNLISPPAIMKKTREALVNSC